MTFILISSSGTMAMAVNFGYRRDRVKCAVLMLATAAFGASFVGMQAFEWTKLIMEGSALGATVGAVQFGSCFFLITASTAPRVDRRDFPAHHRAKSLAWRFRQRKARLFHQQEGALRDRRNHGALLALRRSCVGVHLCVILSLVREKHGTGKGARRWTTAPIKLYLVVWGWLLS